MILPAITTQPSTASEIAKWLILGSSAITLLGIVIFSIWFGMVLRRDQKRFKQNLCMKCGYDLRHSPKRCPECGTPVLRIKRK
jgi:ribosomal protein L40E